MIYVISDTHFGHEKLILDGVRPEGYDQELKASLLDLKATDILYHLGDVCICPEQHKIHKEFIMPIKAKKILLKGNHDNKSNNWYLNNGWDFVARILYDKIFGKNIYFSHEPFYHAMHMFDVNIHGHLHDEKHRKYMEGINTEKHILISLERTGYRPLSLEKILMEAQNA